MQGPETRNSLLLQICDPLHQEAWGDFVAIYEPLIYRLASSKGLQHADAQDLTQEVFAQVGKSIKTFDADPQKGSFRGWLNRITRNLVINFLTRGTKTRGSGDTKLNMLLQQIPSDEEIGTRFDYERRRELFRWAAERVRERIQPDTWQAFWLTGVEGNSNEEAARKLGKTNGTIRIARCRVIAKLRAEIKRLEPFD